MILKEGFLCKYEVELFKFIYIRILFLNGNMEVRDRNSD